MSSLTRGKAWNDFIHWCRSRGLKPLPAHPWTLASYARWCEPKQKFADIDSNLKSIARRHLLAGMSAPNRHPTVKNTLRLIQLRGQNRHRCSDLFESDDFLKTPPPQAMVADREDKKAIPVKSKRAVIAMRSSPRLVRRRG